MIWWNRVIIARARLFGKGGDGRLMMSVSGGFEGTPDGCSYHWRYASSMHWRILCEIVWKGCFWGEREGLKSGEASLVVV